MRYGAAASAVSLGCCGCMDVPSYPDSETHARRLPVPQKTSGGAVGAWGIGPGNVPHSDCPFLGSQDLAQNPHPQVKPSTAFSALVLGHASPCLHPLMPSFAGWPHDSVVRPGYV